MKTLLATSALALALAMPVTAQAQIIQDQPASNETENLAGAGAGGAAGATAGFFIGGPVGAIIGGFAGATLGAAVVPDEVIAYTVDNPVDPIIVNGELTVGSGLPDTVTLAEIPNSPEYGYVYANGRAYIVALDSREVVYSPGYVVSQDVATFVTDNPLEPVIIEGDLVAGYELGADVQITPIPSNPAFSYVYVDGRPVVVDSNTRVIVWAQ